MKCPFCQQHMGVIFIMNIFNAHCKNRDHSCFGSRINYQTHETKTLGTVLIKRIKNTRYRITHYFDLGLVEICYDTRTRPGEYIVSVPEQEYKDKYKDNPSAFKKLIETAETFK